MTTIYKKQKVPKRKRIPQGTSKLKTDVDLFFFLATSFASTFASLHGMSLPKTG